MIYGVGPPRVVLQGSMIDLPHPQRRNIDPNSVAQDFTNLDGEVFKLYDMDERGNLGMYRPTERLIWDSITSQDMENLIQIANSKLSFWFYPHNDKTIIGWEALVNDFDRGYTLDNVNYDSVQIEFMSKYALSKIPSMDNMLSAGHGTLNHTGDPKNIFELSTELYR